MGRPHSTYGQRAKLGLIVPPTNTVNEAEWQILLRELAGVTLHVTRMKLHTDTTSAEGKQALMADIGKAVNDLAAAGPDAIAYGCTAGSMVSPLDSLTDAMQAIAKCPCVATAPALVHAARALGMKRVAVATPYHDALNRHEVDYLGAYGIKVLDIRGLGIGAGGPHEYVNIARVPEEQVLEHCLAAWRDDADGMIISCTDLPTLRIVPLLEARWGKPVISSNLATFWRTLRVAGIADPMAERGTLLQA
ncbi:maleate cis-trans isomerase family protein [Caenimonas soli]|uniref:maleate cis-trans isomerase family protein n=1 Tax=Caenimonas soli TaxID=2735555 RepID=UPI0015543826|nr:aspartate/glutamate racemase family protein [Caenimonas soli]NPC56941.1 decarboxylase [Caenimonas soli]